MVTLASLKDRHDELGNMVSDLRRMLTPEQLSIRPNAMTAHKLLCDLSDAVKAHLAEEDKSIYPGLLIHEDPKIKSIAWGFINGQKPLRKQFDDYHKKWLKDCDFKFNETFLAETHDVLDAIMNRIDREENLLFPKLEKIGLFASEQA